MLFGNRERFAVEWKLDDDPGGHWLFGKICFWVGNSAVGDLDLGTSLSDVFLNLVHPVGDCGHRLGERFCALKAEDAFGLLHRGLFDSKESLSALVEEETWARFDVSLDVDVFDGWRMYLIDCPTESRLLVGKWHPSSTECTFTKEQKLAVGEFDEIIRALQKDLFALSAPFNSAD